MIDPELKTHLETLENEVVILRTKMTSLPNTLLRGMFHGAGYVLGAVLVVIVIGWILNILGVIPAFNDLVTEFRSALERVGSVPVK